VVNTTPRPLYRRERGLVPIVQVAGWALGKNLMGAEDFAPPAFDPRAVQPLTRCCADYAIPAACLNAAKIFSFHTCLHLRDTFHLSKVYCTVYTSAAKYF
jgi:hypothetical protein